MNSPDSSTAAHRVFGIEELFELILKHLSIGAILINAQAVSRRWQTSIHGSTFFRKALFPARYVLDDDAADELLYMKRYREGDLCKFGELPLSSLAHHRQDVIKNFHYKFFVYMKFLVIKYKNFERVDKILFENNAGTNDINTIALQLRSSVVHPFVRHCLWAPDGCYWTGYGTEVVLYIHETFQPLDYHFNVISRMIFRIYDVVQNLPTPSWIGSSIASPAFKAVNISLQVPLVMQRSHIKYEITKYRRLGATIKDLLVLIATLTDNVLVEHEPATDSSTCRGLGHGAVDRTDTQAFEQVMSEVRGKAIKLKQQLRHM
ncbi:hypothetical protein N0V83_000735 [Neocucurbitaria cava]|uniref:F-box domain-containing protein n=1 Tax=Neocucurbitaria cava TaxID=798079 RepID=A0A9W8YGZ8_9PLEO|nr:hypothetical protein N0V83_000735 [Neocucurbitaria cava]